MSVRFSKASVDRPVTDKTISNSVKKIRSIGAKLPQNVKAIRVSIAIAIIVVVIVVVVVVAVNLLQSDFRFRKNSLPVDRKFCPWPREASPQIHF